MSNKYALSSIAYKLSSVKGNRFISEDTVYRWVKSGALKAERAPYNQRGCGKYHLLVDKSDLSEFLCEKGYDVESLFPNN